MACVVPRAWRREDGGAVVEFAVVIPALLLALAAALSAISTAIEGMRLQSMAADLARIVARGDALPAAYQQRMGKRISMDATINGDLLTVFLEEPRTLLRTHVVLKAHASAKTEAGTNDFEQN